jgi:hypothetical protein
MDQATTVIGRMLKNARNLALVLTVALFGAGVAQAADKAAKPAAPPPQAPAAQAAQSNVNGITRAAVSNGVLACTSRINQVTNFLTAGVQGVKAVLFIPTKDPDRQMISISMEIPTKEAASAYASASFAPNQANGCGGMYETVVYWPQTCDEVARKNFATFKKIDAFSQNITVLDGGETMKIFLMPAGTGCISIKKELIR